MTHSYYIIYFYATLFPKRIIIHLSEPIDSERGIALATMKIAEEKKIPDAENIVIQNWKLLSTGVTVDDTRCSR